MKIPTTPVKNIVYPVRFSEETYAQVKKVAKQNKTTPSKVIRYFTEEALKTQQTVENK